MKLLAVRLICPDTLGEVSLSFADDEGQARPFTLIFGGPGSGKTTLLAAIGGTRPGQTVALNARASEPRCYAECTWLLGMDHPDQGRSLVLSSPNLPEELRGAGTPDRRDAIVAERLAREGGFVCLVFSALRWFSKSPLVLTAPDRGAGRYDVRAREPLDDASRNDLTRDVKQALAYAAIVRSLPQPGDERYHQLGDAMAFTVDALARLGQLRYGGLDPKTLEPLFLTTDGESLGFDALPTYLKHCIAFGALSIRAAWSAYPNIDPRRAQAVVLIDEVDLHQDTATAAALMDVLAQQLPEVQWILTTRSSALLAARDESETLALRRLDEQGGVAVHTGPDALVH
jgi:hypothetical protein